MKKKILYLSQVYPYPADGGGKIKTLQTLRSLAKEYEVYAVFVSEIVPKRKDIQFLTDLGIVVKVFYSDRVLASVRDDLAGLVRNFFRGISHYQFQYTLPQAAPAILEIIDSWKPDAIHVDHLNMSQYLPKRKAQAWILEHHNVETHLYWTRIIYSKNLLRKLYLCIEMFLTYFFERNKLPLFDHILAISHPDAMRLEKIFGCKNVTVQPLSYPAQSVRRIQAKSPYILFIGNLGWPPNEDAVEWFLCNIYPSIVKKIPSVRFHVVGKRQPRYEKNWPIEPNVCLHGYQKNINPFLSRADVFILPFRMGGGLRLKSLTALAAGIPVVSTPLGIDGLVIKPGNHCLVADGSDSFAEKTVRLLRSTELQNRFSYEGIAYVKHHHGSDQNVRFLHMYKSLVDRFAPVIL